MAIDILANIQEQPAVLAAGLRRHTAPGSALDQAATLIARRPQRVLLTGMGSSLFASYPAFLRLLDAGLAVTWIELAELLHHGAGSLGPETLLVLVSQSGETVEALRLLQDHAPQGPLIAVTNDPSSSLAQHAQITIPLDAGSELTVATKSYAASSLALFLLAERACGAEPGELAERLLPTIAAVEALCTQGEQLLAGLPALWFEPGPLTLIGRGASLASALAGGLLFKETAKIQGEGMSSAQFRHGPIETCGPNQRVIVCAADPQGAALSRAFANDLVGYGSQVLLLGDAGEQGTAQAQIALPAVALPQLVEIVPLQLLARALAQRQGIEPGMFRIATKVTHTE